MIVLEHLKKQFSDKVLFEDFSLNIENNDFAILTGPSGCGKTTLLNMIGGIEPIDSGKIIVDDLDISIKSNLRLYYREYVGFLFQNFALIERKTVKENLELIKKNARSAITMEEALERVGLAGKENQKVYQLSGGEQQRIALARLMMKKCNVILADEPTGSLDRQNALQVMDILLSFQKMGKTIIMVTHDSSLIRENMTNIALNNNQSKN